MYALKGGWVGQTFALAKSNESGGKKSRIRRSKEERKGMVESFIKKYQSLNNGSFPSLNLTHKEVGGSFYTVREIVREIIQENRVLGPAKFLPEEQNANGSLEHYPLGTISTEPQTARSVSSNGGPLESCQYKSYDDPNVFSYGLDAGTDHWNLGAVHMVNGKHVTNLKSDHPKSEPAKAQADELLLADESEKELLVVKENEQMEQTKSSEELMEPGNGVMTAEVCVSVPLKAVQNVEKFDASSPSVLSEEIQVNGVSEIKKSEKANLGAEVSIPELQLGEPLQPAENVEEFESVCTPVLSAEVQVNEEMEMKENEAAVLGAKVVGVAKLHTNEQMELATQDKEPNPHAKLAGMADITVETFPLRSIAEPSDYFGSYSSEAKHSNNTIEKENAGKVPSKNISNSRNRQGVTEILTLADEDVQGAGVSSLGKTIGVLGGNARKEFANVHSSTSNSSPIAVDVSSNSQVGVEKNDKPDDEIKKLYAANGALTVAPNLIATGDSNSTQEEVETQNEARIQDNSSSKQSKNLTLDRVNLESWKRTSVEQQTDHLWAIFKSFIAAFVKFWSQ